MCQACVDEGSLSQETFDKIEAFLERWPNASSGPGHIVLDDCNLLDVHIKWALGLVRAALTRDASHLTDDKYDFKHMEIMDWYADTDKEELRATVAFLEELLLIPEDER